MADPKIEEDDDDDFFANVYGKEYEGPPKPVPKPAPKSSPKAAKRAGASSDESDSEDEGPRDPNALPTDFTSREARGWEAKAKASERHWKRRKEEELTCKICGISGHFAQGCPLTIGGKRSGEVVERVLIKDKRLKPRIIGTNGGVIQALEKESGCRLKVEEPSSDGSFHVRITGSNRMCVLKGKEVITSFINKVDGKGKSRSSAATGGNMGRTGNDDNSRHLSDDAHESGQDGDPLNTTSDEEAAGHLDESWRYPESRGHESLLGPGGPRESLLGSGPRGESLLGPYSTYGDRGISFDKDSPVHAGIQGSYGGHSSSLHFGGGSGGLDAEASWRKTERMPQTLEDLEQYFLQETLDLSKALNAEEEVEIARHRERMRDIQGEHQRRMTLLRQRQGNQREDFLTLQSQRRLQAQKQQQQEEDQMYAYSHNRRIPLGGGGGGSSLSSGLFSDTYGYGRERSISGFSPSRSELEKARYPPLLHDPPSHYGLNGVGEGSSFSMAGRGLVEHSMIPGIGGSSGGGFSSQLDGARDPYGAVGSYGYGAGSGQMYSSYA